MMLFSDTSNYYKWHWLSCFLMEANLHFIFNMSPLIIFKVSVVFVKDAKIAGKIWAILIEFPMPWHASALCGSTLGKRSSGSFCLSASRLLGRQLTDASSGSCRAQFGDVGDCPLGPGPRRSKLPLLPFFLFPLIASSHHIITCVYNVLVETCCVHMV